MSNYIDSIQLSGTVYTIQGTGGGGSPTVELTQAEYDALVSAGTVSANTYYIITDATAGDLTQYWTSAQTQSAIAQATSGKVDTTTYNTYTAATDTALASKQTTLTAGTNITIVDNVISATGGGGGGTTYSAGRGIDITNDTISFSLPISAGTGTNALVIASDTYDISNRAKGSYSVCLNGGGYHPNYAYGASSLAEGMDTKAYGSACHSEGLGSKAGVENNFIIQGVHAEGYYTQAKGTASHAEGLYTIANNQSEHASGQFNVSNSATTTFGDSGNTLFSVGNGTANNARHNAFEIRQNGDIYCSDGTNDVKLQDTITATAANTTALGGKVETSAITTSVTSASTDSQVPSAKAVYDIVGNIETLLSQI